MGEDLREQGIVLPGTNLAAYQRFTLFNSPYAAHGRGHAIDLYPPTEDAPSPVAGEVLEVQTHRTPPKDYAIDRDYLLLIDVDADSQLKPFTSQDVPAETIARILHVDPSVEPGDSVGVGDSLGTLVRTGYFAPWVDNHIHLGFRGPDANPYRATGSLPLDVDVDIEPLSWDGTGTVVERGDTYVVLDAPPHPDPGKRFAGIAAVGGGVIDGGLCHYQSGGLLAETRSHGPPASPENPNRPVSLLGTRIGMADGRNIRWEKVGVYANDRRVAGLSLFLARDEEFGAKLIAPDNAFEVGDEIQVTIRQVDDPTIFS